VRLGLGDLLGAEVTAALGSTRGPVVSDEAALVARSAETNATRGHVGLEQFGKEVTIATAHVRLSAVVETTSAQRR
jgi:hypothetical protein